MFWFLKENGHTKRLAKSQVCATFHMRDMQKKRFTQIYKSFYGDTMLVSL